LFWAAAARVSVPAAVTGGDHGFAAQQFHQGVDADVGVSELGGEGVAQPVHECAARVVGVDAGTAKSPHNQRADCLLAELDRRA
jgi:hypothetical protein